MITNEMAYACAYHFDVRVPISPVVSVVVAIYLSNGNDDKAKSANGAYVCTCGYSVIRPYTLITSIPQYN